LSDDDTVHCYHHTHDSDCNDGTYDESGEEDECVHCECCCDCMGCLYGPRESVLMTPEQMAPLQTGEVAP